MEFGQSLDPTSAGPSVTSVASVATSGGRSSGGRSSGGEVGAADSGDGVPSQEGEEEEQTTWYVAVDESGNEYISNHFPIKPAIPQYEWLVPPHQDADGTRHAGIIAAPQPSERPHRTGMGMSYPLAGELLTQDPTNTWNHFVAVQMMRRARSQRTHNPALHRPPGADSELAEAEGYAAEAHDDADLFTADGQWADPEAALAALSSMPIDSSGYIVKRPAPPQPPTRAASHGVISTFAAEREERLEAERALREARELHVRRGEVSAALTGSLVDACVADLVAEMLGEEYVLTLHSITARGVPVADELTSSDPYAIFRLLEYPGVAGGLIAPPSDSLPSWPPLPPPRPPSTPPMSQRRQGSFRSASASPHAPHASSSSACSSPSPTHGARPRSSPSPRAHSPRGTAPSRRGGSSGRT